MKLPWTYTSRQLLGDVCGGAIAALIALPYGLAMAALMGLPPVYGLFTSLLTAPVTAILGRNPVLIGGTASATVPFIALIVREQGTAGAAKVCIAASILMVCFCVLRLGRHIAKVPTAVVAGFSCGIGALMIVSQLRTIFGLGPPALPSANALVQLFDVLAGIQHARFSPLLIAATVIAIAHLASRVWPRSPAPLLGVAVAFCLYRSAGTHEKEVGALMLGIPDFAGFTWRPSDVASVLPTALALALVASINILITSRVVEHFRGRHKHLNRADADAELGAYGIANLFAGMFGAPMSVGIPARSLANVRCGGTTRFSNITHAAFLLGAILLGSAVIESVPLAALAGVTAYVGLCLLDWSAWRRLPRMRRADALAFLTTALSVLAANAVAAVAVGCVVYVVSTGQVTEKLTGSARQAKEAPVPQH